MIKQPKIQLDAGIKMRHHVFLMFGMKKVMLDHQLMYEGQKLRQTIQLIKAQLLKKQNIANMDQFFH
jgi:hypothetical protein